MFLHLGGDVLINQNKIVAILDLETANKGANKDSLFNKVKKSGKIKYVSEHGKEKTFIITTDGYYYSPISSTTLLKRSISLEEQEE